MILHSPYLITVEVKVRPVFNDVKSVLEIALDDIEEFYKSTLLYRLTRMQNEQ